MSHIGQNLSDLPQGAFGVILADPPWLFKTRSAKGEGKSPQRHYSCMTDEELCALPVGQLAAKDCALFLWVTWPLLLKESAPVHRLLNAWGFKPSGLAWEWIKKSPATGLYSFGGGYGTRKNLEPCILARKGSPQVKSRSQRDFLYAPRREHSRKPDEQYDRIAALYDGPYVELFAREVRPGWSAFGNELNKFHTAIMPTDKLPENGKQVRSIP